MQPFHCFVSEGGDLTKEYPKIKILIKAAVSMTFLI
jgi:hypothetical protein